MASLTHVCMWSEHGWKRITANEAAKLHPGGMVSAASGLFMCELCGQYVILTDGEKNVRHFRHKISEKSKDCPERTFGPSVCMTYNVKEYELPIKICNITDNQFDLELGLLYVPQSILQERKLQYVVIQPLESQDNQYTYSFERLNPETLTYVYIGSMPAPKYKLDVGSDLRVFWPQYIKGIDRSGSVFSCKTGKKLPDGAEVQVGNSYYLLCAKRIRSNSPNIELKKVCEKRNSKCTWYIYEIKATKFAEDAARFFLDLACRLTESPLSLNPVWPVYRKTPYVIQHNKGQLFMYMHGGEDIVEKAFPATTIKRFSCPEENGKVIRVDCNGRQQLISIGRTNVLEYTYFWREQLSDTMSKPVVEILDIYGNILDSGIQYELPEQQILYVSAHYDGTVIVLGGGTVQEKRVLKANSRIEIENIHFETEIKVMQGLDLVWSVKYERKIQEALKWDFDIVRRLNAFKGRLIPISHELGAAVGQLENYPEVKRWLYKKIRDGFIPEEALRYFKHFITEVQSRR